MHLWQIHALISHLAGVTDFPYPLLITITILSVLTLLPTQRMSLFPLPGLQPQDTGPSSQPVPYLLLWRFRSWRGTAKYLPGMHGLQPLASLLHLRRRSIPCCAAPRSLTLVFPGQSGNLSPPLKSAPTPTRNARLPVQNSLDRPYPPLFPKFASACPIARSVIGRSIGAPSSLRGTRHRESS